jgi:molybdopterin synthase sulfur carrier subunit
MGASSGAVRTGVREEAPLPACKIADMARLRYWAAAKEAAGIAEEDVVASTLAEALAGARDRHSERFATVLARCSFVVDTDPVGGRDHALLPLTPESLVDVLPPFAGG